MIFGIDVSKHQGVIDWPKVSGVTFAICRASLATTPDPTYARNVKGAQARGLLAGAYHFLYPSSIVSAVKQADLFYATVGNPEGLLAVLDVERDGTAMPTIADVRAFVKRWREKTAHPLIIYTGRWYWVGSSYPIRNAKGSDLGPLWLSHYVDPVSPSIKILFSQVDNTWWDVNFGGWDEATLLQFTSSAGVSGISGRVDANAYRGTIDELRLLAYSLPDSSTEEPLITFEFDDTAQAGSLIVKDDRQDYQYLNLADGKLYPASQTDPDWPAKRAFGPIVLPMGTILGDTLIRRTGYLLGKSAAFMLATDVDFTPDVTGGLTPLEVDDLIDEAIAADRARARIEQKIVYS